MNPRREIWDRFSEARPRAWAERPRKVEMDQGLAIMEKTLKNC